MSESGTTRCLVLGTTIIFYVIRDLYVISRVAYRGTCSAVYGTSLPFSQYLSYGMTLNPKP